MGGGDRGSTSGWPGYPSGGQMDRTSLYGAGAGDGIFISGGLYRIYLSECFCISGSCSCNCRICF